MHVRHTGHVGHVRRGKESRYDVTQDNGLFEALEEKRHETSADENQRKVGHEGFK
jgi:hypothetical protein